MTPAKVLFFQKHLLAWYHDHKRDLPWRTTSDPYCIWISEIMAQQTQIKTVIPYYLKFIQKFPNVKSLAEAPLDEVMQIWQGLGYYRRAKLLHQCALDVIKNHRGQFPQTCNQLLDLPGFGPYTAGAVASIAFNEPVPAVDGNVKRVLSRFFGTNATIQTFAERLSQNKNPRDFTESLMELGALVCTPKNPDCTTCPLKKKCKSYIQNQVHLYPQLKSKTKIAKIYTHVFFIQKMGTSQFLIQKRPSGGRWENLWEFYTVESKSKKPKPLEIKTSPLKKMGEFRHQLSHQDIYASVYKTKAANPIPIQINQLWMDIKKFETLPFSVLQKKAIEIFKK